jgi:ABC-type branched-subunit amino acid transport system permease subunit
MRGINAATLPRLYRLALVGGGIVAMLPLTADAYHLTMAVNLCITLILTLSLNFVVGNSGQFHLSHVAFFGTGAYVSAILAKQYHLSPWLCLFCAVPAVAMLAALIGLPVTRLKGLYLAVATLAFSLFVEVLVNQGGTLTGGGYGIQDVPAATIFGAHLSAKSFYLLALAALAMTILIINNLLDSKFGREIIASRDHPNAAAASGINPAATKLLVLVIAASFAAVAGWLHTFYYLTLNPVVLSPELTFVWFFMVLVGGLGSITGVVLGTMLLTLVPELLGFAAGQTVLLIGILMIAVTLFAPRGLAGLLYDLAKVASTGRKVR